jgi:hypothetical protein
LRGCGRDNGHGRRPRCRGHGGGRRGRAGKPTSSQQVGDPAKGDVATTDGLEPEPLRVRRDHEGQAEVRRQPRLHRLQAELDQAARDLVASVLPGAPSRVVELEAVRSERVGLRAGVRRVDLQINPGGAAPPSVAPARVTCTSQPSSLA